MDICFNWSLRGTAAAVVAAATVVAAACNSSSPTQPQAQAQQPVEVSGTITFANAGPANAPIASHSEAGFVVQFRAGTWEVWTGYGNPPPFPIFFSPGGASATGEIQITAAGAEFAFRSVDLYSSLTPIPYVIAGSRRGAKEVELSATLPGVVGNTFGDFRTVTNPSPGRLIDTLTVTLTNPAVGGPNPMGLDNIVLTR
jgi:spore coat protein U-like protein